MTGPRPRRAFWVVTIGLLAVVVEAGAYLIEAASPRLLDEPIRRRSAILREQSERIASLLDAPADGRLSLDSVLGWRYRAGHGSDTDHLNSHGLRGLREYAPRSSAGTLRVAAFGDSFVYGNEVADADAWSAVLEAESDRMEVLNYGVGGYGLDQAFLRFEGEGMALRPDVVLIGFASDDLRRIVNVYRRFISSLELPLTKPRFLLQRDGSLELVPNPLPGREDYRELMESPIGVRKLGRLDLWYSPTIYENPAYDLVATLRVGHALWQRVYRRVLDPGRLMRGEVFNESSSALALQVAVLRAFADSVAGAAAIPVVVMLPDRRSVENLRRGRLSAYAPLRDALVRAGVTVWDAGDPFGATARPVAELFASGGHYSPAGNRLVAEWLEPRLDALRGPSSASPVNGAR